MSDSTVGSWHNSGYFGHYRSRVRNDFRNEYRQHSKPPPPRKFLLRTQQPATKHLFSHHDNRESFLNDALYFSEGLGRRRVHSSFLSYQPDFIAWMPHKAELDKAPPSVSSYRLNFHEKKNPYQQMYSQVISKAPGSTPPLVPRPPTAQPPRTKDQMTTIYRISHNNDALDGKEMLTELNRAATLSARCNRRESTQRAATAHYDRRESVASCLSWHRPEAASCDQAESGASGSRVTERSTHNLMRVPDSTSIVPPRHAAAVTTGDGTTHVPTVV